MNIKPLVLHRLSHTGLLWCIASSLLIVAPNIAKASATTVAVNSFVYNPRTLTWQAINDQGRIVRTGKGSGGRSYCRDTHRSCHTPVGVFHIWSKGGSGCKSSRYPIGRGGSPMPYCMFFTKYYAVHGSYEVPNYNASHGCIRIHPSDAAWLSKNFMRIGTRVVVKPY
jgi:lipoprotein-anchoring transpeptidase ErfK/SrfK